MNRRRTPEPSVALALSLMAGDMWEEAGEILSALSDEKREEARVRTIRTLAPVAWLSPPPASTFNGHLNEHGQAPAPVFLSAVWRVAACFFRHGRATGTHSEVSDENLLSGAVERTVSLIPRPAFLDPASPVFDHGAAESLSACARNILNPSSPLESACAMLAIRTGTIVPETTCILQACMFSNDGFEEPLEELCRIDVLAGSHASSEAIAQACRSTTLGGGDRLGVVKKLLSLGADPVMAALIMRESDKALRESVARSKNPCGEILLQDKGYGDPATKALFAAARIEAERRSMEASLPAAPSASPPSV